MTTLVGRDELVAAVERLLSARRLVTLTGPGGAGKTRLAIGVAQRIAGDSAWFVDLTATEHPAGVPEAVATAVGLPGLAGERAVVRLVEHLAGGAGPLVLDNCEHLVDGCTALVGRLLAGCPRLRILATSRISLRLPAEALVPVPPLALAPVRPGHTVTGLAAHPATRLFLDRAHARSGAPVPAGSADAVARLCAHLDGLPLAIELAAAWTSVLSVAEIADRIAADPLLLRSPDPIAPNRHSSLAAAVETSLCRLDDEARSLFEWLAVFPDGFDGPAAAAVRGPAATEALAALADASLVSASDGPPAGSVVAVAGSAGGGTAAGTRYRMLTPIRRHALVRLRASGAEPAARQAHARHVLRLAERAGAATLAGLLLDEKAGRPGSEREPAARSGAEPADARDGVGPVGDAVGPVRR